jgi:hypothetical protein
MNKAYDKAMCAANENQNKLLAHEVIQQRIRIE